MKHINHRGNMKLRHFLSHIDGPLIADWVLDDAYATFFRSCVFLPSFEDCMNYPAWSQNMVMMVEADGKTVGMVTGYHANFRSRTIKSAGLIDKRYRRCGHAYNAQVKWIDHLFNRRGMRKVIVEIVDKNLIQPFNEMGFKEEGRYLDEAEINGEFVDEIRMGCFKESFRNILKEGQKEMACQKVAKVAEKVDLVATVPSTLAS